MRSFYLTDAIGLGGPWVPDGQIHDLWWVNATGAPMMIHSIVSWIGVDKGGVGDVWFFIHKGWSDEPLHGLPWDHYTNPTTLHTFPEYYNPPEELEAGNALHFMYFGQPGIKHGHFIVKVRYEGNFINRGRAVFVPLHKRKIVTLKEQKRLSLEQSKSIRRLTNS